MGVPIADIHLRATSVGGLPVCTFPPTSYHRVITAIVVGNSTPGNVKVYKGTLDSIPVQQNSVGDENTLTGSRISIPAGQPFFIRWGALGANASDAFARVSMERVDNPLEESVSGYGAWAETPVRTITIPSNAAANEPRIVITADPTAQPFGSPLDAAILLYWNETDFFYIGVQDDGVFGGILLIGVEIPSIPDGHIISEIQAGAFGGDFYNILSLVGRDDAGLNIESRIFMSNTMSLSGDDGLALSVAGNPGVDYSFLDGVDPISASRGVYDVETTTTAVTGFTTTETVVHTLLMDNASSTHTYRRYAVRYAGRISSSVAGDRIGLRVRQTNAAGTIERECGELVLGPANIAHPVDIFCLYTGRNVLNETVVLTARRTAGTGTITYTPDSAYARDETGTDLT